MDTHTDTATDHMRVSNVETNTTARTAQKPETLQQNVLSVVEVIHQTIKDVSAITISSETETTTGTPGNRNHPLHKNNPTQTPLPKAPHPRPHRNTHVPTQKWSIPNHRGPNFHTHDLLWRIQKRFPTTPTAKQHDSKHALNANKQTPLNTTE